MTREKVADLRRAFDGTFARPHAAAPQATERLLRLRVSTDPYAARLSEVASLSTVTTCLPLPSRSSDLLGMTVWRGALVPLFDLARLIGYAVSPRAPSWMIVVSSEKPIGLAFARFEGHADATRDQIRPAARPEGHGFVNETAPIDDARLPLIDLKLMVTTVHSRR